MASSDRDSASVLEYVAGDGSAGRRGWVDHNGQPIDTVEKLADHLAAVEAAAVANGH